jgi:hypothetical protein
MRNLLKCLWADENGFIISAELVLVGTIVGLGMCVGLAELSSAINRELHDCAQGFSACNNSWSEEDSDWDDSGIWSSDSEQEQSGGDFYGNY